MCVSVCVGQTFSANQHWQLRVSPLQKCHFADVPPCLIPESYGCLQVTLHNGLCLSIPPLSLLLSLLFYLVLLLYVLLTSILHIFCPFPFLLHLMFLSFFYFSSAQQFYVSQLIFKPPPLHFFLVYLLICLHLEIPTRWTRIKVHKDKKNRPSSIHAHNLSYSVFCNVVSQYFVDQFFFFELCQPGASVAHFI